MWPLAFCPTPTGSCSPAWIFESASGKFCACIFSGGVVYYKMPPEILDKSVMGKGAPRRCDLLGAPLAMMCLPPASEPVKPLADVVNGYTCSDSQDKILDEIRHGHLPPSHYRDGVRTAGIFYQISTPSASAAFAASKRSPAEKEPLPKRQGLLLPFPRRGRPPKFPATFIWGIAALRVLCYTILKSAQYILLSGKEHS